MRRLKLLALAAVLLTLLLGALWATSPYILHWGAAQLGARWGVVDIELSAERPGLSSLHINRLAGTAGGWRVEASDVDILYLLGNLRMDLTAVPVKSVQIAVLRLHQVEPATVEPIVAEAKGSAGQFADNPAQLWQRIFTRVPPATIQQLELVVDAVGFNGRGKAALTADGLSVDINGVEPIAAANFKLSAQVLPTGEVALDFFDVSQPLAPFVTGTAAVADKTLSLALEFVLQDYPLQLISKILDLPQGSGRVAGDMRSQTAWPVDPAAWPALAVEGSLTVDWQSDALGLTLSGLDAGFHGTPVHLSAQLQGKLNWQDPELTLAFPPGFTVEYADDQILLGPDIAFDLQRDEKTSVSGKLGASKLQLRENPTIVASAIFSTAAGTSRATGKASGQLQVHSSWPVNFDAWKTLPMDGSLDVDWRGDTGGTSKLATRFTGTPDNLKMDVQGRVMMQDPQLTVAFPPGFAVVYADEQISLGPNIAFDLKWDEQTSVSGKLGATKLQLRENPTIVASAIFSTAAGAYRAQGKASAQMQVHSSWPVNFETWKTLPMDGSLDADWRGDTKGTSKLTTRFTGTPDNLKMDVQGRIMLQDPQLTLVVPPRLKVNYTAGQFSIGPDITFDLQWDEKTAVSGKLGASKIVIDKNPTLTTSATFNGEYDSYRTAGKITGVFSQAAESIQGQGQLTLGSLPAAFTLRYAADTGRGHLTATGDHKVTRPLMANVLKNWQEPYDMTGGQVRLGLKTEWSTTADTSKLAIELIDVEASYKEDVLQGINGTLNFTNHNSEDTGELVLSPSALTARRADLGVTIEDLAAELALRGERLFAREVSMRLLGGYARANEIELYLPDLNAAFVVEVEDLDLAQVLALEGEDITGTGSLRGTLPLQLRQGEFSMSNGRLVADPPGGRIALSPSFGNATGQPGLDFAVQALTNFSYEKLAVEAEYTENGDLKLAVALQGRNPAVEKGRPIHYNLTINENLLALMESLRVQRAVTDKVEQQVKKKKP